jgi:hypothetical protein
LSIRLGGSLAGWLSLCVPVQKVAWRVVFLGLWATMLLCLYTFTVLEGWHAQGFPWAAVSSTTGIRGLALVGVVAWEATSLVRLSKGTTAAAAAAAATVSRSACSSSNTTMADGTNSDSRGLHKEKTQ